MTKDLEKLSLCKKAEVDAHISSHLHSKSWYQQNVFMSLHRRHKISDDRYFKLMCRVMGKKPQLFSDDEIESMMTLYGS